MVKIFKNSVFKLFHIEEKGDGMVSYDNLFERLDGTSAKVN